MYNLNNNKEIGMDRLLSVLKELKTYQDRKKDLESEIKVVENIIKNIVQEEIPDIMENNDLDKITLKNGVQIHLAKKVRATFPKEISKIQEAANWLEQSGNSGMLKRQVGVEFTKGDNEKVDRLMHYLSEDIQPLKTTEKTTVHPQTMSAFIREKLEEGENVPMELFNVYIQREAVVKEPIDDI